MCGKELLFSSECFGCYTSLVHSDKCKSTAWCVCVCLSVSVHPPQSCHWLCDVELPKRQTTDNASEYDSYVMKTEAI